ncbi:140up [Drosophila busckii]|uniref:Complex I assembly factor TIMMDC1, mitochondrial n=1 Tax=Drosophila busckii TaxID=30019 RepID=A0A0M4EKD8_DROBS|nr:RPII140-upstream gene protein [Drosophila busckii]ALC45552.1 140up [Drosophila busckii]
MRLFTTGGRFLIAGILPLDKSADDIVDKESKTYKAFLANKRNDNETGMDRIKQMFTIDEFGSISSELNSIYQAGFLGFLVGAIYGGVIQSRSGYMNFMESNQATAFKSHLDAKKKMQDQFTVNFAKGGFKWGWRVGLFTTSYLGIITCISVYRGKSSIYEYLAAGTLTGGLYKVNMGLRGMAAGGIIGGFMGGVAGAASLLLMKASGTSMEEVRYWQYKWRQQRDDTVNDAFRDQAKKDAPPIFSAHDNRVGDKVTLDPIK